MGYEGDSKAGIIEAWRGLVHEDDLERFFKSLNKYFSGNYKKHFRIEYRTKPKDGKYKWILTRGKAIWDENGSLGRSAVSNKSGVTEPIKPSICNAAFNFYFISREKFCKLLEAFGDLGSHGFIGFDTGLPPPVLYEQWWVPRAN
jgi:hypothetical protein